MQIDNNNNCTDVISNIPVKNVTINDLTTNLQFVTDKKLNNTVVISKNK